MWELLLKRLFQPVGIPFVVVMSLLLWGISSLAGFSNRAKDRLKPVLLDISSQPYLEVTGDINNIDKIGFNPSIDRIYKKYRLKRPAYMYGKFFDNSVAFDIVLEAVDDELFFKDSLLKKDSLTDIPFMVSPFVYFVYSRFYREVNKDLPDVSPEFLTSIRLNLVIGASIISGTRGDVKKKLYVLPV